MRMNDAIALALTSPDFVARFWARIDKSGECWLWTGTINSWGYGSVGSGVLGSRWSFGAHRVMWTLRRGAIGSGLSVCHTCDNPRCVRPEHLWLGTTAENSADMVRKGRSTAGGKTRRAKLNQDKVREIRGLSAAGHTQRALARKFGVAQTTINKLLLGTTWGSVKGVASVSTHLPSNGFTALGGSSPVWWAQQDRVTGKVFLLDPKPRP